MTDPKSQITNHKSMRVVRIIARLNVGGPARHVVWLTKSLQTAEFESVLLTGTVPEGEEDMSYFAYENGVEPVFIPEMSRELSPQDAISLWKVFRRLCREKPAVIHTHTAKAGTVGRLAGFFYRWLLWKRVRLVHTFHGHVFHSYYSPWKTRFFIAVEKILARLATDKIIVISDLQKKEINEKFGVGRPEQFEVIRLGLDLAPFADPEKKRSQFRTELGADEDEILVGFVGRLTEIKNVALLLRVAELYKTHAKENLPRLRFVIIGDGHLRTSLEKTADERQIRDVVTFLGNRTDSPIFYAGLDIVALSSLNEGTPLSLIEAMANGKAVISTEVGGVGDLLGAKVEEKEGFKICERGLAVQSDDADGFYKGLLHLAENPALQKKIGSHGRTFVLKNYSRERLVGDIENLYRKLLQS